ncbi:hypothetical protein SS50377_20431 [Spironucleus salmonicida]|uniref:Uncharacterized protein n=1 Tax=Spironucleus salmonicida TaxID=348837 RepID=V6LXP4_9EUKA|nr:hypothetical protein SS50377_20431 [Spironucleus salmonicida]|eukprot:EST45589.1 Hypothetical protein SS50377_14435 [Spironucleus salmonicida]
MSMRTLSEVLTCFYGEPLNVPQHLLMKHSKKPQKSAKSFQETPGPIYEVAKKLGSNSPSYTLHTKHKLLVQQTPGPKYDINLQSPVYSASICVRRQPIKQEISPPIGRYDVQKAFEFVHPRKLAHISEVEIVKRRQQLPGPGDYAPEAAASRRLQKTLGGHRDMRLYVLDQESVPAPNAYHISRSIPNNIVVKLPLSDQGIIHRICSASYINKDDMLIRQLESLQQQKNIQ